MKNKKILFLFVINAVYCISGNMVHPVTPTLIQNLGFDDYMFGVMMATVLLGSFLLSPTMGKVTEIFNSKISFFIGAMGYATGQLIMCLAHHEALIVLARFISGGVGAGAYVGMVTYCVNYSSDEERGRNLALSATISAVFTPFGFFVGGLIGEYSIPLTFAIQITLNIICGIVGLIFFHAEERKEKPKVDLKLIADINPFRIFAQCRPIVSKALAVLLGAVIIWNVASTSFDQCFNYYLRDFFGLTSGYNGIIKASVGLISLAANTTICLWLMRRTDTRKTIILLFLGSAVSITASLLMGSLWPFVAFCVMYYAFNSMSQPILQDLVVSSAIEHSSLIVGLYNSLKSLGGIFGALFAGMMYSYNPRIPFGAAVVFLLLASICVFCYQRMTAAKASH